MPLAPLSTSLGGRPALRKLAPLDPHRGSRGAEAVNIFLCRPESVVDHRLLSDYERLLDREERVRFSNFRLRRDAHAFLVAHALVRAALSQVFGVAPEDWRFRTDRSGRPEVEGSGCTASFSLSHCEGLIAAVVVADRPCGIDVEEIRPIDDAIALADSLFAPSEAAQMRDLPEDRLLHRFYSLWTLKEAYMKACGLGLALPLDFVSFDWEEHRLLPSFRDGAPEASRQWTFALHSPTPSHVLATALAGAPTEPPLKVVVQWLVPLLGVDGVAVS
jgi:4'-phosphopantetheinyl transferase